MPDPAEMILEDIPEPNEQEQTRIDRAWKAVALKRAKELREGRAKAVPWEEAVARVKEVLARRRKQK